MICHIHQTSQKELILGARSNVEALAGAEVLISDSDEEGARPPLSAAGVLHGLEFYVPLADLIDLDVEIERLSKERDRVRQELKKVIARLSNEKFTGKAPADVVDKERNKQSRYEDILERLERNLSVMQGVE